MEIKRNRRKSREPRRSRDFRYGAAQDAAPEKNGFRQTAKGMLGLLSKFVSDRSGVGSFEEARPQEFGFGAGYASPVGADLRAAR